MLARWGHLEAIPDDPAAWDVKVARAAALAETLRRERPLALLFRQLATLRTDVPVFDDVEELRWQGATPALDMLRGRLRVVD